MGEREYFGFRLRWYSDRRAARKQQKRSAREEMGEDAAALSNKTPVRVIFPFLYRK